MLTASIITATITFGMTDNVCQTTRRNVPEDSQLHTCGRENLKSRKAAVVLD
jgi:hypothetical protein